MISIRDFKKSNLTLLDNPSPVFPDDKNKTLMTVLPLKNNYFGTHIYQTPINTVKTDTSAIY